MVDRGKPGVDSRDKRKHSERNDLLCVENMSVTKDKERVLQGG